MSDEEKTRGRTAGRKRPAQSDDAVKIFSEVAAGSFRPLYLFYESDPLFFEEFVRVLKERLLIPGLEFFDFEKLDARDMREDGLSVAMVLQRARQAPVGGKRRLVVIEHLEDLRKDTLERLCAGLAELPDSATVVASCDYDKGIPEIFKRTGVGAWVVHLPTPSGEELVALVAGWARSRGLRCNAEAAQYLVEVCGADPAFLKGEVEKLTTVLEPGEQITIEAVRRYASSTRVFDLEDFLTLVLERKGYEALRVLRRLEQEGEEPVRIVVNLGYALFNALKVKTGLTPARVLPGARSIDALRCWSPRLLGRALDKLYEINKRIVSGYPEPFVLIDMWVTGVGMDKTSDERDVMCFQHIRLSAERKGGDV